MSVDSSIKLRECFECGVPTNGMYRVVPKSKGGTKLLPLCMVCQCHVGAFKNTHSNAIKEGLRKARLSGVRLGPKAKVTDAIVNAMRDLHQQGLAYSDIAKRLRLSVGTVHNYLSN